MDANHRAKPPRDEGRNRGFSLVELMVSITVLGIMVVMSVPTLCGVIENGRIRTVGESMKYGLALARTEAVRLNTPVEFVQQADGWRCCASSTATLGRMWVDRANLATYAVTDAPVGELPNGRRVGGASC